MLILNSLLLSLYDAGFEKEFDENSEFCDFMSLDCGASQNHSYSRGGSLENFELASGFLKSMLKFHF